MMIRTQVSLSQDEYEATKRDARRLGTSLAELLRQSLRAQLSVDDAQPWMRYAGFVESSDAQSGRRIDDVVYGQKDRRRSRCLDLDPPCRVTQPPPRPHPRLC